MNTLEYIKNFLDEPKDVIYLTDVELLTVIGFFPEEYRKAALRESINRKQSRNRLKTTVIDYDEIVATDE